MDALTDEANSFLKNAVNAFAERFPNIFFEPNGIMHSSCLLTPIGSLTVRVQQDDECCDARTYAIGVGDEYIGQSNDPREAIENAKLRFYTAVQFCQIHQIARLEAEVKELRRKILSLERADERMYEHQ